MVEIIRVRINAIRFIFFEADVDRSKLASLFNVSVTRIGDTLSYCYPRTE